MIEVCLILGILNLVLLLRISAFLVAFADKVFGEKNEEIEEQPSIRP